MIKQTEIAIVPLYAIPKNYTFRKWGSWWMRLERGKCVNPNGCEMFISNCEILVALPKEDLPIDRHRLVKEFFWVKGCRDDFER